MLIWGNRNTYDARSLDPPAAGVLTRAAVGVREEVELLQRRGHTAARFTSSIRLNIGLGQPITDDVEATGSLVAGAELDLRPRLTLGVFLAKSDLVVRLASRRCEGDGRPQCEKQSGCEELVHGKLLG